MGGNPGGRGEDGVCVFLKGNYSNIEKYVIGMCFVWA